MRNRAADDYDIIRVNLVRIRDEAVPRCPMSETRTLHDCLRNTAKCTPSCPYVNDWIGPQT